MVQWKGEIEREESGRKAYMLDQVESFEVPSFFVITRSEIENGVKLDGKGVELGESLSGQVEEAYKDLGVSSEVRDSSGEARELVEGQRNNHKVSVRASGAEADYFLDVGLSDLEKKVESVLNSVGEDEEIPAIIVQKMVEPGFTGSAVKDYGGGHLVETVKGSGHSLERGIALPEIQIVSEGEIEYSRTPDEQRIISKDPMTGQQRQRMESLEESLLNRSSAVRLTSRLEDMDYSVKFVYRRGTFHVVDVFKTGYVPGDADPSELDGLRVSPGDVEGVLGEDVALSGETVHPENYQGSIVCRSGGYTSRDAEAAREYGRPAVFSYSGNKGEGDRVSFTERRVGKNGAGEVEESKYSCENIFNALEVVEIGSENGIHFRPPFKGAKYAVTDIEVECFRIPSEGYIDCFSDFFGNSSDRKIVDVRKLEGDVLDLLDRIEGDFLGVLVEGSDGNRKELEKAVERGFDLVAVESGLRYTRREIAGLEKKFMMDRLREL